MALNWRAFSRLQEEGGRLRRQLRGGPKCWYLLLDSLILNSLNNLLLWNVFNILFLVDLWDVLNLVLHGIVVSDLSRVCVSEVVRLRLSDLIQAL